MPRQFPGTNFHDLNLDWILNQVKTMIAEWQVTRGEFADLQADWETEKAWFENYITEHYESDMIDYMNSLIADGTFLTVITPQVNAQTQVATDAWLQSNISQETGYVLDESLTLTDAAAQAKAAGDVKNALIGVQANKLPMFFVKNSYVKTDGDFASYTGWKRTDYIPVVNYKSLVAKSSASSTYNVFYDSSYAKVSSFTVGTSNTTINIPTGAVYVAFSNTNAGMDNLTVKFNTISDYEIEAIKTDISAFKAATADEFKYIEDEVFTGEIVTPTSWELGTINWSNGSNQSSTTKIRHSGRIQLKKFDTVVVNSENYRVRVYRYGAESGSYDGVVFDFDSSNLYRIASDGYYRFVLEKADESTIIDTEISTIVASLSVITYVSNIDPLSKFRSVTTTVLGANVPPNAETVYNIPAGYITALKSAIDAWMAEYAGDLQKIPFILHTDQHGRLNNTNKGLFDLITYLVNWDSVSAIINLGDSVVDHWEDDNTNTNPLLRNGTLENMMVCLKSVPSEKQINIWGNHDTWYSGSLSDNETTYLPSLQYLNPYFPAKGLRTVRCPDNSNLMVVYDDVRKVRYICCADWDYTFRSDPNRQYYYVSAEHWKWIIEQLTTDCGYDIVILSHVALLLGSADAYNPITNASKAKTTPERFITQNSNYDNIWTARKNNGSGTISPRNANGEAETISYDFTNCTDKILCSLSGHEHDDAVDYAKGDTGLLVCVYDWFENRTIHFGLIDRRNNQVKMWKLSNDNSTPAVETWDAPFDKPTV